MFYCALSWRLCQGDGVNTSTLGCKNEQKNDGFGFSVLIFRRFLFLKLTDSTQTPLNLAIENVLETPQLMDGLALACPHNLQKSSLAVGGGQNNYASYNKECDQLSHAELPSDFARIIGQTKDDFDEATALKVD